jgi:hypothetical protein
MRIEHVMKKDSDAQEEVKNIIKALKAWVNCKFLNELYFKTELYDLLFSIPDEYSVFDAETKMREIPDGEATWRSISNDTYKMIAFILTQNSFNSNQLNLLFVRNIGEFKQKTGIRTHELNSIISYLKGDSFSELLNFITNEEETKTNKEQVITKLESMISLTNSLILREVIDSELDPDLVDKYAHEIKTAVEKHFDLILHLDNIHLRMIFMG